MFTDEEINLKGPRKFIKLPIKIHTEAYPPQSPVETLRDGIRRFSQSYPTPTVTEADVSNASADDKKRAEIFKQMIDGVLLQDHPMPQFPFEAEVPINRAETVRGYKKTDVDLPPDFGGKIRVDPELQTLMAYNPWTNEILVGPKSLGLPKKFLTEALAHEKKHQLFDSLSIWDQQQIVEFMVANYESELSSFYSLISIAYPENYFLKRSEDTIRSARSRGRGSKVSKEIKMTNRTSGQSEMVESATLINELFAFSAMDTDYDPKNMLPHHTVGDQLVYTAKALCGEETIVYKILQTYGLNNIDKEELYEEYLSATAVKDFETD